MGEIKRSGFISIVGRPNVGKSTLLNALTGEKIAIVTNKPQTTRTKIIGIKNEDDAQMIFIDTPGFHAPKNKLGEYMVKEIKEASEDVDITIFVVLPELPDGKKVKELPEGLIFSGDQKILVINKIDLKEREELLPVIAHYAEMEIFDAIIPVSAKTHEGIDALKSEIKKNLAEGPAFYPEDQLTDRTEREIAAEMIREKLLIRLSEEVPHGVAVQVVKMESKPNGALSVSAEIYCEKESHKGIIIGKKGALLKSVGIDARKEMENFFEKKVYLELWVKVREDWRNKSSVIRDLGFGE